MKTCKKCGARKYDRQFLLPTGLVCSQCHGKRRDAWRQANPDAYRARAARWKAERRRYRRFAPKWADLEAIARFYEACPVGHHVDHVIPVNGERVTGLHVLANLQYLPAAENIRKGEHFTPRIDLFIIFLGEGLTIERTKSDP